MNLRQFIWLSLRLEQKGVGWGANSIGTTCIRFRSTLLSSVARRTSWENLQKSQFIGLENPALFFLLLLLYNISSEINKTAEGNITFYTFCLWYFLWLVVALPKCICSFNGSLSTDCKNEKLILARVTEWMVASGYTQKLNTKLWAIVMSTTNNASFFKKSFNNWERKCIKDLQPKAQQQNLLHTNHTNWGRVTSGPKSEYTQWRRV